MTCNALCCTINSKLFFSCPNKESKKKKIKIHRNYNTITHLNQMVLFFGESNEKMNIA